MSTQDHFPQRHYESIFADGPFGFLNPTTRYFNVEKQESEPVASGESQGASEGASEGPQTASGQKIYRVWRSRDNRKGRHAIHIAPEAAADGTYKMPAPTNTVKETLRGILRMITRYPVWDVSYDVAVIFTFGSAIWCINGFFEWLPLQAPWTQFPGEVEMGGGLTAFLGATVFEIGSILLMLEAVNENRSECFGWALEEAVEDGMAVLRPNHQECRHSHRDKMSFVKGSMLVETDATKDNAHLRHWSWWPSWYELKTHYFHDVGFLACFSQTIGATIFWIAGFTGLPPIYNSLSTPAMNGIYWLPQVIGGTGFIISSCFFMMEVQHAWYIPNITVLGWHVGFWNLIGAIGFTLCGALGFAINQPGVAYASTLATFIGSWSFLVGSLFQWYESLDKYPITIEKRVTKLPGAQPPVKPVAEPVAEPAAKPAAEHAAEA